MEIRSAARPASSLLAAAARHGQRRLAPLLAPLTTTRGHKTTARTKRSLKIAPHDSFLPDRSAPPFPAADSIIYNPPASEASPEHTPFLFLPSSDPRRAAVSRMRKTTGLGSSSSSSAAARTAAGLPPAMRYPRRADQPRYHLSAEQVQEMRRLRNEDPLTWSVTALARRFECSQVFVQIAAPAPASHEAWLEEQKEKREARWGNKKTAAREDRKRRTELMYRGEL
ncbi:60S ribosomal protein L20 [Cordyceps javanica]|uniref:60S ribosomal protein L20 n=1 Tax=Cordyceps javanica TaxID=43265 RepID=A0A545VUY2_9HYPO|nr:60S ribosomal protein L20 [Cordyceps javanica]TQW05531.1 60S ribosomal protein L20 [Cordyceps javanica]